MHVQSNGGWLGGWLGDWLAGRRWPAGRPKPHPPLAGAAPMSKRMENMLDAGLQE